MEDTAQLNYTLLGLRPYVLVELDIDSDSADLILRVGGGLPADVAVEVLEEAIAALNEELGNEGEK